MNQWTKRVIVKGCSHFKGSIDGNDLDSGALFIEEELDDKRGNAKGFRTVEYRTPDSEAVRRIFHNTFPVECDVTFELTTTKRDQKVTVADVKPATGKQQQPAPMPRAA